VLQNDIVTLYCKKIGQHAHSCCFSKNAISAEGTKVNEIENITRRKKNAHDVLYIVLLPCFIHDFTQSIIPGESDLVAFIPLACRAINDHCRIPRPGQHLDKTRACVFNPGCALESLGGVRRKS
jgi:hypothetical protein